MKAIVFKEANFDYKLADNHDGSKVISEPPTFRGFQGGTGGTTLPCIVLCYEVTDKDLQRMRETNRLWLIITGTSLVPITLQSEHPFIINKGEETAGAKLVSELTALDRYRDVIKRCQRILGEHVDPESRIESEETISKVLAILDNKDFCEFMDKEVKSMQINFNAKELLNDCLPEAMRIVRAELSKDKEPGSYYYGWQSNLAMIIADELDVAHPDNTRQGIGNRAAIKFLDTLIGDAGDLTSQTIESGTICGPKEVVMQPGSREREEEIIRIPKQFDPAWRETVKEIVVLSVDQQRIIKEMTEFIETTFAPIDEIQILEDKLAKAKQAGQDYYTQAKIHEDQFEQMRKEKDKYLHLYNQSMQLLEEAMPATIDTPELQQRIIDFIKQK